MSIATTLREAYNRADPSPLPPGDDRYVNCNDVRGDEDVVIQMFNAISLSDKSTHQLFTGHRGCGKSTELLRLKARLEKADFCVVYFAVDDFLDSNDLIYTDLLLCIARRVVEEFSQDGKIQILPEVEQALTPIERWFAETVYTQEEWDSVQLELKNEAEFGIGLPKSLPFIARLLAKYTGQIQTGDKIKTDIRRRFDNQINQLIEQLNGLILKVDAALRKRGKKGFVIIVDSLDRMTLKILSEKGDGHAARTSFDALFIEHGEQLCALKCHAIYTVPISMVYSPKARLLDNIFAKRCTLPMIRNHNPQKDGGGDNTDGLDKLKDIIGKRIDINALADTDAIKYLCQVCGGHPRDLMLLLRQSIEAIEDDEVQRITLGAAERAVQRFVRSLYRMIPEDFYAKLAQVHLSNNIKQDGEHLEMLYYSIILEYLNCLVPWYDVHPAVLQLPRFTEESEKVRNIKSSFEE